MSEEPDELEDVPDDYMPGDHVANMDQLEANAIEVGGVAATLFTRLQESGFSRKEAFELAATWWGTFWSGVHVPPHEMMGWMDDDFGE